VKPTRLIGIYSRGDVGEATNVSGQMGVKGPCLVMTKLQRVISTPTWLCTLDIFAKGRSTLQSGPYGTPDLRRTSASATTTAMDVTGTEMDATGTTTDALPFHEPSVTQILIHVSFILLLNIVNHVLDALTYCGLVGQVVLGVFWGTPLGGLLPRATESTVVTLGYLGLILIVYEGGLNTSLRPLVRDLVLSSAVATTGIVLPIALSFLLGPLADATRLQCFAAGAALSATSLGTTFTILASAGMTDTRLGTVLTSAAMMDDVVGLVMIQIVASLGGGGGNGSGAAVGRPVGASVGLVIAVVVGGWGVKKALGAVEVNGWGKTPEAKIGMQTAFLLALVAAASYAGASVLFAAFLAGAAVAWWDDVRTGGRAEPRVSGVRVFETYYSSVNRRLLAPFFFVSSPLQHQPPMYVRAPADQRPGVDRLLDPGPTDVRRRHSLERTGVLAPDADRKAGYGRLALPRIARAHDTIATAARAAQAGLRIRSCCSSSCLPGNSLPLPRRRRAQIAGDSFPRNSRRGEPQASEVPLPSRNPGAGHGGARRSRIPHRVRGAVLGDLRLLRGTLSHRRLGGHGVHHRRPAGRGHSRAQGQSAGEEARRDGREWRGQCFGRLGG